jgi:hypothetical protein
MLSAPKMPQLTSLGSIILAFALTTASAAETGTKTLPSSSIYPPETRPPVFRVIHRHECFMPSSPCDNNHRVTN